MPNSLGRPYLSTLYHSELEVIGQQETGSFKGLPQSLWPLTGSTALRFYQPPFQSLAEGGYCKELTRAGPGWTHNHAYNPQQSFLDTQVMVSKWPIALSLCFLLGSNSRGLVII